MNDARPRPASWQPEGSGVHPQSGKGALAIAAIVGISAIVGYAAMQSKHRATAEPPKPGVTAPSSLAAVSGHAASARESLDVTALDSAIAELDALIDTSTLAVTQTNARLELLDTLAARALEASVRASVVPDQQRAGEREASKAILRARELGRTLEKLQADPGRLQAAMARVELAVGTDITESDPIVLMPTYRDPELRLAALSAPVWRAKDEALEPALVAEVTAQLQRAERPTTLVRLLTAAALQRNGDSKGALAAVDEVLRATPKQPTAAGMRRMLGPQNAVAIADAPQPAPEPEPRATAVAPPVEPTPPAEPEPAPEPVAEPKPKPTPVAETPASIPAPVKPKPDPLPKSALKADPTPAAVGEPADPEDGAASNKKKYKALLDEGCKLVRSGNAEKGFEVLTDAFDLNPNAVAVTVCMAEAHHKLGRDASARSMCERALKKAPNDRRARLLAAELEEARGNTSGALEHYKKVLEKHPDDAKAKAFVDAHGGG